MAPIEVEDKMWLRTSASQIQGFLSCERFFHYRWIEKRQTPQTPAQELGEDIHAGSEIYLLTGRDTFGVEKLKKRFGKGYVLKDISHATPFVKALKPILPTPQAEGLVVEHPISIKLPQGITMIGFLDIALESSDVMRIQDIKTSSSFKYAKTPEQLPKEIQMISYARAAIELGWDGPIELSHLYVQTKLNKTKPPNILPVVSAPVTVKEVNKRWEALMPIIDQMAVVAELQEAQKAKPTGTKTRHCYKYGGCPFAASCGLDMSARPFQGLPSKESGKPMSKFTDKINAMKKQQQNADVGDGEEEEVAAAPARAKKAAKKIGRPVEVEDDFEEEEVAAAPRAKKAAKKIGRPVEVEDEGEDEDEDEFVAAPPKKSGFKAKLKANGALAPDAPSRTFDDAEEEEEEVAAAPAKRGRPKGSKNKKASAATEKIREAARRAEAEDELVARNGFTLYIDCSPVKCDGKLPVLWEDWFAPLADQLNAQALKERSLPNYLLLPYAEEKAAILEVVEANLDQVPSELVMTSSSPGARDACGVLIPHAAQVVRATR